MIGLGPVAGPSIKRSEAASGGLSAVSGVRRSAVHPVAAQDALHLVFQVQLDLFQSDFFELFGLRSWAIGEAVYLFVEGVVTGGKLAGIFVALQQLTLQLFEVVRFPPPDKRLVLDTHEANLSQGRTRFKVPYRNPKSRVFGSTTPAHPRPAACSNSGRIASTANPKRSQPKRRIV